MQERGHAMIRRATEQDASRIAEIQIFAKRKAYRPIFQNDHVSFNEMQVLPLALYFRDEKGALDGIYVYDDGIVKGMMKLKCASDEAWELKELYVEPFFQGEGVGRALMEGFLASARARGVRSAFLWVLEENAAARRFYEAQGYAYSGERMEFAGTGKFLLKYGIELRGDM